jgi:hypothetical protein
LIDIFAAGLLKKSYAMILLRFTSFPRAMDIMQRIAKVMVASRNRILNRLCMARELYMAM